MKETALLASVVVLFAYYALAAIFVGLFRQPNWKLSGRHEPPDLRLGDCSKIIGPKSAYWTCKWMAKSELLVESDAGDSLSGN